MSKAQKQNADAPSLQEPKVALLEFTAEQKARVLLIQKRNGQLQNQILSAQVLIHRITGEIEQTNTDLSIALVEICKELGVDPVTVNFNPDEVKLQAKQ